jgi:hypothetical protein
MIGVLQAETLKLLRHRGIWGLLWIMPIGMVLIWILAVVLRLTHVIGENDIRMPIDAARWISGTAITWNAATYPWARWLVGGFAALAFAGEYRWSTWKLIVPHRDRLLLIGSKYLVVLALAMVAFTLNAVLSILTSVVDSVILGPAMPEGIGFGALLSAHILGFFAVLLSTLQTIAYAAAGGLLLRSTLAGAILAIVAVTLERMTGISSPALILMPEWLPMVAPGYHLDNLQSWIVTGRAAPLPLLSGAVQLAWAKSVGVLLLGLGALIGATCWSFRRQDLV